MRRDSSLIHSVVVVATLVVALLAAALSGVAAVAGRGSRAPSASAVLEPIDGYPQRIGFERPSPQLPDRPGPLAATMFDNDFGERRELGEGVQRGIEWALQPTGRAQPLDGRQPRLR